MTTWERVVHSVTVRVFGERFIKPCVYASFPFGFEDGMWNWIVLITDPCFSIYLKPVSESA